MNTILITGSAKSLPIKKANETSYKVIYSVMIWAAQEGKQIELITMRQETLNGYDDLWQLAKRKTADYFKNEIFLDGAYTSYLDNLILLNPAPTVYANESI